MAEPHGAVRFQWLVGSRHLTKGQRAMAIAMLSPEPKKLKRKQNATSGDHGIAHQRIADARAVLAYSPELADKLANWTR